MGINGRMFIPHGPRAPALIPYSRASHGEAPPPCKGRDCVEGGTGSRCSAVRTMGRRDSTKLGSGKCTWWNKANKPCFNTGLQGNKTVVQRQGAENEWIIKDHNRKLRCLCRCR